MIREDTTNLRLALIVLAIMNAVLLAGLAATAGVLVGMAGSERFSREVAVRLHLAPREEVQAARETAAGAQKEVSAVRRFVEDGLNRIDDGGNDVVEIRAVLTDLQSRLDSLQNVGRIEDLAGQISDLQRRFEATCTWARSQAQRAREERTKAAFRAYVTQAC